MSESIHLGLAGRIAKTFIRSKLTPLIVLGTSEWLTAHGRSIRNQGIMPDVTIELTDDGIILSPSDISQMTEEELLRTNDETLLEAIKVLKDCYRMHNCRDVAQEKLVITR